jgi:excinuclease ABC subunit A
VNQRLNKNASARRPSPGPARVQNRRGHKSAAPDTSAMMKPGSDSAIRLRGVRHNNLKNFDLDIPIGKLTVITGLSGSGKSSLAFDTLFAEGQRRYIETFSPYARQFFDRMDKPQVDRIEGIPPAIAIEQRNSVRSTRSTVGTMTELCDYLKLLWPHLAQLHCRKCGQPVRKEPPQVVWEQVIAECGTRSVEGLITFTIPLSEKLSLKDSLELIARQGYRRLLAGSEIIRIDEAASHSAFRVPRSTLTVVQDRLKLSPANRTRFIEACEQAYHFGKGRLAVHIPDPAALNSKPETRNPKLFSAGFHCAACDLDYPEPTPALFSFNHPVGACPACKGFGRIISIDYDLAIPDRSKTLAEGAVKPWQTETGRECQIDLAKACRKRMVPLDVPFAELSDEHQRWVIEGDAGYDSTDSENSWPCKWYGVKGYFRWLESKSYKMHVRVLLSRYRAYTTCADCQGRRLKPEALLYRVRVASVGKGAEEKSGRGEKEPGTDHPFSFSPFLPGLLSLADFYSLSIGHALALVEQLAAQQSPQPNDPLALALNEVRARLRYLLEVGLGYLTLDRPTRTLSGGETERVNLTTCLGTRLVNTLFVLDEPSVGLHPRDTARLIRILEQLRDTGNTVVVVEHEGSVMRAADQIVDLGPGQGEKGGEVVFCGPVQELLASERSLTGRYLSGGRQIEIPMRRAVKAGQPSSLSRAPRDAEAPTTTLVLNDATLPDGHRLETCPGLRISNATRHNLENLSVEIPLGRFVALTGVSGSGKTTLVREVLLPALQARLGAAAAAAKASDRMDSDESDDHDHSSVPASQFSISGFESLDQVVLVDQSPLGKTPRSNPVVYLGAFDDVRDLFAQADLAKQRGLNGSAFSFNSAVGQCERCRGAGFEKIEMQFLSDIFIRCPECNGRRYREHILEVKLCSGAHQWSVADMLEATVDDALEFLLDFIHLPSGRRARSRLQLLQEVGLGYLRLGQPINTLSGGESQRLKLVSHLAESAVATQPHLGKQEHLTARNTIAEVKDWLSRKRMKGFGDTSALTPALSPRRGGASSALVHSRIVAANDTLSNAEKDSQSSEADFPHPTPGRVGRGEGEPTFASAHASSTGPKRTLFLFDEPTTGLHFEDVRVLLQVFQRIVDAGHSVVVIEHNLDIIKCADWILDLGPDAGERGGELVIAGTPEQVAACERSHTGRFLREILHEGRGEQGKGRKGEGSSRGVLDPFPPFPSAPPPPTLKPVIPASTANAITLRGAREHNLKNLSLDIPRGKFVVVTGVSGSGKSTLAFDLLFAEGQRRFLDSMNTYARQFVEQLARPDVDLITGLPPTVSIEQRTTRGGGKSTVATVTEVYHFFRLLFARLGTQYCPDCRLPVEAQTRDALASGVQQQLRKRGDLLLLAPVVRNRKGFHSDVAEWAAKHGYKEIRADGKLYDTSKPFRLDRFKEHDVEIVVGLLEAKPKRLDWIGEGMLRAGLRKTPQQLIEATLDLGKGTLFALDNHGKLTIHSTERACPKCARSFAPLDPKNFSYNSAQGWCPKCRGFGELFYLPEVERGANADAIEESWWGWASERQACPECQGARLRPEARAVRLNLSARTPALSPRRGGAITSQAVPATFAASGSAANAATNAVRSRASAAPPLPGERAGVRADHCTDSTIDSFSTLSVTAAHEFFRKVKLNGRDAAIARDILPEIVERLKFLDEVGLGYLQLGRGVTTLSGGEAQRIRLAAQLGSNLSGVLYVLDEPTIGLHARDNEQLLAALHQLQSRGNSLVVVEHDEETMRRADYIIDLGPGAGAHGGTVVAAGTLPELLEHDDSITGRLLRAQETKRYPTRGERRAVNLECGDLSPLSPAGDSSPAKKRVRQLAARNSGDKSPQSKATAALVIHNAAENNLKNLTVRFPLNRFVVVTGVSGSGKSTLVRECLLPAMEAALKSRKGNTTRHGTRNTEHGARITSHESLRAVYEVDQSPIGRTPRSTPATYVGFFDDIRALFAQTPEARMRGYTASRFSFNSAQGRCPECEGSGAIKLEMNFLPPAFVKCETCGGQRFSRETLDIEYAGKNIAQVLDLSVEEAIEFFAAHQKILRPLQALHDTGLDYLKLGQTSPTLSGGEAQRVKLVTHLLGGLKPDLEDRNSQRSTSNVEHSKLFILEEPTIGLHMSDVRRLVEVLQRLVDSGHSVIVIEHNLDLIAEADWVIDLGPEGGEAGGHVVGQGTPEGIAAIRDSHTGRFLRKLLHKP